MAGNGTRFSPQRPRVNSRPPESPLLHTQFRISTATSARDSQLVDPYYDQQWRNSDYYEGSSGLPVPPSHPYQDARHSSSTLGVDSADNRNTWRSDISSNSNSGSDVFAFRQYESIPQPPMLVISSPASPGRDFSSQQERVPGGRHKSQESASSTYSSYSAKGRTKSIHGTSSHNFSRPFRPVSSATSSSSSPTSPEFSTFDQSHLPEGDVMPPSPESRSPSPTSLPNPPISILVRSPSSATQHSPYDSSPPADQISYASTPNPQNSYQSIPTISLPPRTSPNASSSRETPTITTSTYSNGYMPLTPPMTGSSTMDNSIYSNNSDYPQTSPSIRSVYSDYSYYDPEAIRTSPSATPPLTNKYSSPNLTVDKPKPKSALKKPSSTPNMGAGGQNKLTASDYLQMGITAHENNKLPESASYFELSATLDGGCGFGMLMWGLSLRSGWGVKKDEKMGFKWLRRAAEWAVEDLEGAVKSNGSSAGHAPPGGRLEAVQSELVLAIYEVGQCFFHGWGVAQDKKMAVSYFQVAARLGDADAQQELGFCYANGKGCKKDRKEAAKWYRLAAAQGISTVGLAWIYKEKYS
ncbi:hypothetical protein FRC02_008575 [Tulasnella sp. 418]|nr:hypothetical protein FRC02_008575 [Tulasnella sp. 418]